MPKDHNGESRGIAFIEYTHRASVPYALQAFVGTKLFHRPMNMRSRNNTNAVPITPQYIEANNPLTAPGSSARYGYSNQHMQPTQRGYGRPPPPTGGNPFEAIDNPDLLMALTTNLQATQNSYQDLGKYDHQRERHDDRSGNKHRGNSYRSHEQYNPYKNDDRRDDGGRGGSGGSYHHRDRERSREWTNGSRGHSGNSSNRRRF